MSYADLSPEARAILNKHGASGVVVDVDPVSKPPEPDADLGTKYTDVDPDIFADPVDPDADRKRIAAHLVQVRGKIATAQDAFDHGLFETGKIVLNEIKRDYALFSPELTDTDRSMIEAGLKLVRDQYAERAKTNFEVARKLYEDQQKMVEDAGSFSVSKTTRGSIAAGKVKLQELENEFRKARAEYASLNAEAYMTDQLKSLDTQAANLEKKDKNAVYRGVEKVRQLNERMSRFNFVDKGKYNGKFKGLVRFANGRTMVSAGLLASGYGLAYGGYAAVAGGSIAFRRLFGGTASGVGTYSLIEASRRAALGRDVDTASVKDVENRLAKLMARATLDGNQDSIKTSKEYIDLSKRYLELLKETPETLLLGQMQGVDNELKARLGKEKWARRGAIAVGTVVGYAVGSGEVAKVAGKTLGGAWKGAKWTAHTVKEYTWDKLFGNVADLAPHEAIPVPGGATAPIPRPGGAPPSAGEYRPGFKLPDTEAPKGGGAPPSAETVPKPPAPPAPEAPKAGPPAAPAEIPKGFTFEETIPVKGRGIEGAIIDYLKNLDHDSDKYKTLIKLYGDVKETTLAHRIVEKFAQEKGFDVAQLGPEGKIDFSTSTGHDLSKIIQGAEVRVTEKGFEIGTADNPIEKHFIPAHETPDHPVHGEAKVAPEDRLVAKTGPEAPDKYELARLEEEYQKNFDALNEGVLTDDARNEILQRMDQIHHGIEEYAKAHDFRSELPETEEPIPKPPAVPEVTPEDISDDSYRPEPETTQRFLTVMDDAEKMVSKSAKKTIEGLKLVLGKSYDRFLSNEIGLSKKDITSIQDKKWGSFLKMISESKRQQALYGALMEKIDQIFGSDNLPSNDTRMGKVLLDVAREFKK